MGKVRKKDAAKTLRVSRQMLDLYLDGKAMPGPDVILRAMKEWNFPLNYRGREITSSQLSRPMVTATHAEPEQLLLPLKDAIHSLDERDLSVRIAKKEPDGIQLEVSIKFPA